MAVWEKEKQYGKLDYRFFFMGIAAKEYIYYTSLLLFTR